MVPMKYLQLVQTFLIATFMTFVMSFAISWINLGLVKGFIGIWMHAWLIAFAIAFPTLLLILPAMRKLAVRIASKEESA
ncbi:DUF2798 domain-containing protein [Sulfurimonas sp. HSL-3221]|uniref:DUF2798 domain-containing protein n=1 Tax=Sulfurimonadaceae TaxID=2771471 RepID=UPI001E2F0859|nr:DUF2798 domain-containing protein [Sulfurimonas sp. HSL-3221]UFS61664.1 DUF2798 domain-containing protein [Sulfurimonas sp. HSL-3221]